MFRLSVGWPFCVGLFSLYAGRWTSAAVLFATSAAAYVVLRTALRMLNERQKPLGPRILRRADGRTCIADERSPAPFRHWWEAAFTLCGEVAEPPVETHEAPTCIACMAAKQ